MVSETIRYLATGGTSVTLCGGLLRLIALKMRIRFNRHVVDRAFEQGQAINPAEIIQATALRTRSDHLSTPPTSPGDGQRIKPGTHTGTVTGCRNMAIDRPQGRRNQSRRRRRKSPEE